MSFLAGMLDTQSQANRMGAQRDRNALLERQQLLAEEERAYEKRTLDVNAEYDLASTSNWLDKNRLGLGEGFSNAVKEGDRNAIDYSIQMINNAGIVEGGGQVTALVRDEKNGGFRATVTNPDGSIGVKTVNGSKEATDETIFVSDKDLLKTANTMWDATVIPYQDKIRTASVGAIENVIKSADTATNKEIEAELQLRRDVAAVVNAVPAGASRTALVGVISSAEDREEQRKIVTMIAQDQQIELSSAATTPTSTLGTTTATAATATPPSATAGGNSALYDAVEQVESGGDNSAVSPAGATGVMQLMPETAKNPGFGIEPVKDDSEEENRRVGREYLDALLKKYDGNLDHALAAYNYGPGNIDEWIANGADPKQLPQETQDYLVKVKGAMKPQQPSASIRNMPASTGNKEPDNLDTPFTNDELKERLGLRAPDYNSSIPGSAERVTSSDLREARFRVQIIQRDLEEVKQGGEIGEKAKARLVQSRANLQALFDKADAKAEKRAGETTLVDRAGEFIGDARSGAPATSSETSLSGEAVGSQDNLARNRIAQIDRQLEGKGLTSERRQKLEDERASLEKTVSPVAEPQSEIVSDQPEIQQQFDDGSARLDGKTAQEQADMIVNGEISLSPQARATVAKNLQRQGVQNLQDLKRLNNKDRAIALAALAGTIKSEAEAGKLTQQILNLMDGGELMSPKDRATINQNTKNYAQKVRELDAKTLTEVIGYGDKLIEETFALFNDPDVPLSESVDSVLQSGTLATYWSKLQRFNIKDFPEEHEYLARAANIVLSKVVAGLSQKNDAGIFERLAATISRDDVTPENADGADMFLKRVIKVGNTIQYISPPTLVDSDPPKWKYEKLETSFPIEDLRRQNAAAARLIINVAEANSKRYGSS